VVKTCQGHYENDEERKEGDGQEVVFACFEDGEKVLSQDWR
jgi:hypothetical protein